MPTAPGLIIAAPASGSGKTLVTLAILRALRRAGVRVASCKVGPDYIDPAFHAATTGSPCFNLDLWAMRPATVADLLRRLSANADLIVCEGAMGLFDGAADGTGSTADVAAVTGWPVILVIDARRQGASAAALLRGFATHRDDVSVSGVIFNQVGSKAHAEVLQHAAVPLGIPVVGCLPRSPDMALAERHLGLVQASERADLEPYLDRAAEFAQNHLDLDLLQRLARATEVRTRRQADTGAPIRPLGQRIAVASDKAFSFAYPLLLQSWREAGAELSLFSPLADECPRADCDAVFLPGGYPELHAGRLAANWRFIDGLRAAARDGAAVYGECGGYMVLGETLVDVDGTSHMMAGLLPLATSFADKRLHLGYRSANLLGDGALGRAGNRFRGHEFHYATVHKEGPGEPLFACTDARGLELRKSGLRSGTVFGSFVHLIDCAGEEAATSAG